MNYQNPRSELVFGTKVQIAIRFELKIDFRLLLRYNYYSKEERGIKYGTLL